MPELDYIPDEYVDIAKLKLIVGWAAAPFAKAAALLLSCRAQDDDGGKDQHNSADDADYYLGNCGWIQIGGSISAGRPCSSCSAEEP